MPEQIRCFSCERPDAEVPILLLVFQSHPLHICPQCLPILIHHPERLAEKLLFPPTAAPHRNQADETP